MDKVKKVIFNSEAQEKIFKGMNTLANAVKSTLGPGGKTVLLDRGEFQEPLLTKDGVSVASAIKLEDRFEDLSARVVMQASKRTAYLAGDGTSTSIVLVQAILNESLKYIAAGANVSELKRGLELGSKFIIEKLKEVAKPLNDYKEITQVATISANGDSELGDLIAKATSTVGGDGLVMIRDSDSGNDELHFLEGFELPCGYVSPFFISNQEKQSCEYENPLILLSDNKVNSFSELHQLAVNCLKAKKPLVIIAQDFDSQLVHDIVQSNIKSGTAITLLKAPFFGEERKKQLQDLSIILNTKIISNDLGLTFQSYRFEYLGTAEKIEIFKDRTVFIKGSGSKEDIDKQIENIKHTYDINSLDSYQKKKFEDRLARLNSKVAIIKVGGSSEIEINEKKDRVDDAIFATKAAILEGIIPGGGVTLLKLAPCLKKLKAKNYDQLLGLKILESALTYPIKTIANNSEYDSSEVITLVNKKKSLEYGFNARSGKYVNMYSDGIIDPVKVTRLALEHAVSVSSTLLTTSVVVAEKSLEEKSPGLPF